MPGALKLDHYAIKDCCDPTLQKPAQYICQALCHVMIAYLQFVSLEQANAGNSLRNSLKPSQDKNVSCTLSCWLHSNRLTAAIRIRAQAACLRHPCLRPRLFNVALAERTAKRSKTCFRLQAICLRGWSGVHARPTLALRCTH
jgi:hypothetical protein